jgi:hypothetical protein
MEQRTKIKFCFETGETATKTFMLTREAYGDNSISYTRALELYFGGLSSLKTRVRMCKMIQKADVLQPRNAYTIANVHELVTRDRGWAVRMIAEIIHRSFRFQDVEDKKKS